MSAVLDFLLDLILDWDEIPSYEHLVKDAEEPGRQQKLPLPPVVVVERKPPIGVGVIEVHDPRMKYVRRIISSDMSYEEYQERQEPDRGEQAFEKYSVYR